MKVVDQLFDERINALNALIVMDMVGFVKLVLAEAQNP